MLVNKGSKITVPPRPVWSFISTYFLNKYLKEILYIIFWRFTDRASQYTYLSN